MRVFALLAIAGVVGACNVQAFACGGDDECSLGGEPGLCVAGNCAYPDPACPSGYRYAAGLSNGLAGQCVPDDDVAGSDTEMGTGSGTSTAATTGSSAPTGTSAATATTLPPDNDTSAGTTDGVDPVTTEPPDSTGPGDPGTTAGETTATTTGADSTTAAPSVCLEFGCADCMRCVDNEGEACEEPWASCTELTGCPDASGCMEFCVDAGECSDDCCAEVSGNAQAQAIEVHECRMQACDAVCEDIEAICM